LRINDDTITEERESGDRGGHRVGVGRCARRGGRPGGGLKSGGERAAVEKGIKKNARGLGRRSWKGPRPLQKRSSGMK